MRVVVTGAAGGIGRAIVARLDADFLSRARGDDPALTARLDRLMQRNGADPDRVSQRKLL